MKRILLACIAIFMMVMSVTPAALANHGSHDFYPGTIIRWSQLASETYCLEDFDDDLTSGEETNLLATVPDIVNGTWEAAADVDSDWHMQGGGSSWCANTYDFYDWDCSLISDLAAGMSSRIDYQNMTPGDRGETRTCDLNNDDYIDFFWIIVDRESTGYDLHWNSSTTPAEYDWDFAGLLAHEFGHATGFQGHFNDYATTNECDIVVTLLNAMCQGTTSGWQNDANGNGTWFRSLETHDLGAINAAYP